MKGIYVIAIASLASWAVSAADFDQEDYYQEIPTRCPFPEKNASNIAHETDCTKYYKCDVGVGVEQDCPKMIKGDPVARLHFNRRLQVCDWPWQAGCEDCPLQYPNGTFPPPSKIGHEVDDCTRYYECINGVKHENYCPSGSCFSRTCQACVTDRRGGNCGPPPIPTISPPPVCTNPDGQNGDKRPHDCSCLKYYICSNTDWVPQDCEGGRHFSPTEKTCLPANGAGCTLPRQ